ncbi:alpha,alpha-trehalase nth1 [Saitozyma podzolica]|uniref:Trehalase n=1 Tax=Saitozyma podzolica TaxID=1890683 RepID=A0A427YSJ3_9TREE|nr:alpha,alpha-trehalase nth1 [Saitozyma podzolica]
MTGSFALSRSLSEADIAPIAKAKALENKADNALSFTRHAIIDHFRPHRPSVITGLVGPHPLEPGLQPLSPSLLRAALTLPVPTAVSVSVSVPVEQPNSPKTPTLVQSSDPESPSSPETPAGEIHFAFPSSFVAAEVPPPRINISKAFPKMTSNGVPSGPTLRAKLPHPKNLLFIEPEVTPRSGVTTPTEEDPLAAAGAHLAETPQDITPHAGTPPEHSEHRQVVSKLERLGKLGQEEKELPAVNAEPSEYYGGHQVWSRARTFSDAGVAGAGKRRPMQMEGETISRNRRLSHDEVTPSAPRRFLVDVEETMRIVLEQEDTDKNFQISIYDSGPKLLSLGTASSNQYKTFDIRGTYMLSNLLQELALARDYGRKRIVLDESRLAENPVDRLSRMIKNSFWNALTRRYDAEGLEVACADPKNRSQHNRAIIYVPHGEDEIAEYYDKIAKGKPNLNLSVERLPIQCDDPYFVKSLNDKPGILALAMDRKVDPVTKQVKLEAVPFVVPGARFNEKYGWDSYFMALGLLVDGRFDLAMNIVEHCIFEIRHYNKVLNGNRSYYLGRSQPPFLTDLAVQIFNQHLPAERETLKPWLKRAIKAAIKEYHKYWMVEPSLDPKSGLSRYRPAGLGIPPETEASHFTHILQPYAQKKGISVNEYIDGYNDGTIKEPELDEYFMHDRGVRESGHDTTYRLDRKAADLATVDLNSLLYKYESDIATAIEQVFGDHLELDEEFDLSPWPITPEAFAPGAPREKSTSRSMTSAEWKERAQVRKDAMDRLCWNDGLGMYFDYDTKAERQARYESVTTLWPLWAGSASEEQAIKLVHNALPKLEVAGGLVSGTEESRGIISLDRPNRQWDYPYAWPPHQIMAWVGLERYGLDQHASRLAYRWIYMMTLSFVDFNGIVPEKFDAVELSHMVDAEYGNQGTDFRYVPREGFGWMNAAYQVGLQFLSVGMRRAVAACVPPWVFFNLPAPDFPSARLRRAEREAREAAAAASGHGGTPKAEVHNEPPSLEQAIAALKLDLQK